VDECVRWAPTCRPRGYSPDPTTKAVAVPIYQTVAYAFDSAQHGADLFDLKVPGNIYTRIMNPTTDVLEKRVAALEGGIAALAVASGMAAITYAIQTIAEAGDNIVSAQHAVRRHLQPVRPHLAAAGHRGALCRPARPGQLCRADRRAHQGGVLRIHRQPAGQRDRHRALAEVAHAHGVPLIVDNTVPSPYLCRPFEHGADIVVHSLTKYLGGHGNSIGGIIVDSGKFPWAEHKERFKRLNEPDVSYHGVVYTEALGPAAYIGRARVVPLRNMGAALSPFNAFLILQGIETLAAAHGPHLRQHAGGGRSTCKATPRWLGRYAGLPDHPDHALVQKYMGGRASGILSPSA
jgi:O-acetylhomoserine (thiol)-lyase